MRRRTCSFIPIAILALATAPLRAQGPTTGAIHGTVQDHDGVPLPGVRLEARSPSLQGTRAVTTDAEGRFRLPSLPPGLYSLSAILDGFVAVESRDIRVALAETATLPLTMKMAMAVELDVTAGRPLLDVTSSTGGQNVRFDVIRKLPVGRNYADILRISPGVGTDNAETQGRALAFTIYGATSLENQYLVDGANTTNVIKGFQGKALPNEFVEEVQIKSSGYEAEYGRALGGVINVITKSGGNELHGDVFGYVGTKGLTASRKTSAATDVWYADKTSADRYDYGAGLGGPFWKDRLWFFGAYNRVDTDQDQIVLAGAAGVPTAGQSFPIAYSTNVYSGKLTLRLGQGTTLVGTVFGDPERREGTLRNYNAPQPITREGVREVGGADYTFSALQLLGARGLVNARFSHHEDAYELAPKAGADVPLLEDRTVTPAALSGGFGSVSGNTDNNTSTRDAWKLDGTLFAGAHEIKAGAEYETNHTSATPYYSGGQLVTRFPCPVSGALRCPAGQTSYYRHTFWTGSRSDPAGAIQVDGPIQDPKTYRLGFFVQDTWRVGKNLTVNMGLRYDQDDIRDQDDRTIMKLDHEWQPRLGLAWDVLGDGRSRVSFAIGRFYYALPTALTVLAFGNRIQASTFNFSPTALEHDPAAPRALALSGGLQAEPVQDDIEGIYQDELTAGFDRGFDETFSVGVRYTYRNLGRMIEDRCDFDAGYPEARGNQCAIFNPGSDSPISTGVGMHGCTGRDWEGTAGNPSQSQCISPAVYPVPPMPAARRVYHGIELVARKRVEDRLFLQASYVYSRLRGNYDGAVSNLFGVSRLSGDLVVFSVPGWYGDFDYPDFLENADGKLFLDRPHAFRLDVAYTAPFGLGVGFQGYLRSGAPISRIDYYTLVTPRGSEGRQPWSYEVNLQLEYPIRLGPVTVTAFGQGFNLLNKQTVLDTYQWETVLPPTSPSRESPDYRKAVGRSEPRSFRFGARFSF